jgi:hypothetical protein
MPNDYDDPLLQKRPCPTSIFPDAIDGFAQLPLMIDGKSPVNSCGPNSKRSAIINIELTLGTNVQGDYNNVRERLEALEAGGIGGLIECCDLQDTTDMGYITTNPITVGKVASAAIISNIKVMVEDLTLINGYNGMVVGPFAVDSGVLLTIPEGATFVVI